VKHTLLAWLAVAAIGGAPAATAVCAWSCAASHHSAETAHHHGCEEPATGVVRLSSAAPCADHASDRASVAVGSVAAYAAPSFHVVVLNPRPHSDDHSSPLRVSRGGAGPPSPDSRSILRI